MKRRITTAIVGVTAMVLLALGIPLALAVHRSILASEVVELHAAAAETLIEVNIPFDLEELALLQTEPDTPPPFALYDSTGTLFFGDGPPSGDAAVESSLGGATSSTTDGLIVVATPIFNQNEQLVGVVRLSESLNGTNDRTRVAWLTMAAAAAAALGAAWLIANRLAKGLSSPVTDLATAAAQMGRGGVIERRQPSGIAEIDLLDATLVNSSHRIHEALSRERRFSADVSHQLRTPLAGLRLKLEAAAASERAPVDAAAALGDVERIEQTVAHLLAFARDAFPVASTCPLAPVISSAVERWTPRAAAQSRVITSVDGSAVEVRSAAISIDQILDVLIDNALAHGRGDVTLVVRTMAGGAAIDVVDQGSLTSAGADDEIFHRGNGTNNGIGLALARSIAEAEGGRLLIARRHPTTFSLFLLTAGASV